MTRDSSILPSKASERYLLTLPRRQLLKYTSSVSFPPNYRVKVLIRTFVKNIISSVYYYFFCRLGQPSPLSEKLGGVCRELHVHPNLPRLQINSADPQILSVRYCSSYCQVLSATAAIIVVISIQSFSFGCISVAFPSQLFTVFFPPNCSVNKSWSLLSLLIVKSEPLGLIFSEMKSILQIAMRLLKGCAF